MRTLLLTLWKVNGFDFRRVKSEIPIEEIYGFRTSELVALCSFSYTLLLDTEPNSPKRCLMKRWFFIVSALGVSSMLLSQAERQKQSDMIIAAEREWAKAAVDRDIPTFSKYMSDDYVLIAVDAPAGGKPRFEITTKSSWVEKVRSGREKYDSVEIHDLKVFFNEESATVTGTYSQKGTSDGKDISASGIYVDTWQKRNGQWKLINSTFP